MSLQFQTRASIICNANGHQSPIPNNMLTSMSPPDPSSSSSSSSSSAPPPSPSPEQTNPRENLHKTRFASKVFEAPVLSRDDFTPEEVGNYWWSRREIFLFELKKDDEEEWDIRNVLPARVIQAVAVFLKTVLGAGGMLLVLALLSVAIEIGGQAVVGRGLLPEPAGRFIVESVRPNIVTALLVLVGVYIAERRFPSAKAKTC